MKQPTAASIAQEATAFALPGAVPNFGFALKSSLQALMHGAFQGTLSGITGGGFWAGAASGALSSLASSAFSGGENTKLEAGKRVNAGGGWKGAGKFAKSTTGMIAFGTVMGGAGAALTGGNFWQGAVTGLVVSGLNHAMDHGGDPLNKHRKEASTLDEWESHYNTCTENEIITEAGWKDGQPLGPQMRYVINPVDNKVMDMRHVSVVGNKYGYKVGELVEHIQNLRASTRPSAFDLQDYYSNKIGDMFSSMRSMGSWASKSWLMIFKDL